MKVVGDRDTGRYQVRERAGGLVRLHVPFRVVIPTNDRDAGMVAAGFQHQLVKVLEVVVVP